MENLDKISKYKGFLARIPLCSKRIPKDPFCFLGSFGALRVLAQICQGTSVESNFAEGVSFCSKGFSKTASLMRMLTCQCWNKINIESCSILFQITDITVLTPISRNESECVFCHSGAFVSLASLCAIS